MGCDISHPTIKIENTGDTPTPTETIHAEPLPEGSSIECLVCDKMATHYICVTVQATDEALKSPLCDMCGVDLAISLATEMGALETGLFSRVDFSTQQIVNVKVIESKADPADHCIKCSDKAVVLLRVVLDDIDKTVDPVIYSSGTYCKHHAHIYVKTIQNTIMLANNYIQAKFNNEDIKDE